MRLVCVLAGLLAMALSSTAFAYNEGDFLVRSRAILIDPKASATLALDVRPQQAPEFDFSYFFTKDVSLELILATARHEILLGGNRFGRVSHLPPTVLAQYHLAVGRLTPYAGLGLNYTLFYAVQLPATYDISKSSLGPAFQVGTDYSLGEQTFLNFDAKYILISTDVSAAGRNVDTLKINPLVVGVGIGFRI